MKKIMRTEWMKLYPVKKILLGTIWLFLVFEVYAGSLYFFSGGSMLDLVVVVISFVAAIWSFTPIKRYVTTPYRCMPYFNGVLTKKEMEALIEEEEFKKIKELKGTVFSFYFRESENWYRVNGRYISKRMCVLGWTEASSDVHNRDHTPVCFVYFTGDLLRLDLGIGAGAEDRDIFERYLKRTTDMVIMGRVDETITQQIGSDFKKVYQQDVEKEKTVLEIMEHPDFIKKLCRQQLSADVMRYHEWLSGPKKM